MRLRTLAAAVALIAPLAFAADGVQEVGSQFRHADGGYQPTAHGGIGIRTGPDFDRFSVGVEGIGELTPLRILMGDGHENFSQIGELPAGLSSRHFERTTREGGHLPLEAAHIADLAGRGVRIVDGENHLILVGEVPHFADTGGGGEEPPPPPPPPVEPVTTRAALLRPDGSPFGESRGVVIAFHGENEDALRCEVGRLAPEHSYLFYVGEGEDAVLIDDFRTNGEGGALIGRETATGQAFSDHLPALSELAGRHVEIQDLEHHVILYGHVPGADTPHDAEPVHHEEEHHDATSGADVHLVIELHPDRGIERMRMEMHDLPHETPHDGTPDGSHGDVPKRASSRPRAEVLMDDGTGNFDSIASVRISRHGRARVAFSTRRGRALPLGAATLRELVGRAFEVRVNGARAVAGTLSDF